jgi:hypothetical protein
LRPAETFRVFSIDPIAVKRGAAMKRILLPFVSALIASNIFAAPISFEDAKRARGGVPMYDVVTLSKYLDQHMGEHIAVLCHSRGKDIHHFKSN